MEHARNVKLIQELKKMERSVDRMNVIRDKNSLKTERVKSVNLTLERLMTVSSVCQRFVKPNKN